MSTSLPVQLLVSVNGGSFLPGTQTGGFTQVVAMKAASTAQLTSIRYEISDYPIGFGVPAGWSVDPVTNAYFFAPANVTTPPPSFTIGSSGPNNWGPFMYRLRGNNNPLQLNADGTPNTSYSPQLTDSSACTDVVSPNLGMQGLAAGMTTHLDPMRAWIGPLMQALRLCDNISAGGGPFTAGGDLSGTSISQTVQRIHGATVPVAGALTTGSVLQATGPSTLAYAAVNLALAAAVTGILPVANGGTGLSGVGANGTVLTVVSGAPAWVAPAASGFTAGGDLSGSSTVQNVIAVHGASVPIAGALTTGNVPQVTGPSTLGYAPVNLAGGPNFVTGVLPAANQAAQTMGGDVTGTAAASVVARVNGATVPISGALTVGNVLQVSGASALSYAPINLASSASVGGSLGVANGGTGLSSLGSADQLLGMTHAGTSLAFFTPSAAGDATLASGSFKVIGLQGFSIATTTPTANQVLTWNAGTSKWTATTPGGAGSVTGSGVWHSTGGALDAAASHGTAGQALFTNAGATDTAWTSFSGDVTASTGTPGQITVVAIQAHAVASTAPTEGQFLIQGAASWAPTSLSGDVSASVVTPGLTTVVALQGFSVATTTPTSGQLLQWNAGTSKWTPTTAGAGAAVTGSGFWHSTAGTLDAGASHGTAGQFAVTNTAATDATWVTLSGDTVNSTSTAGAITVTGIRGNPVSASAATAGQVLIENAAATGSAWTSFTGDVSLSTGTPGLSTVLAVHGATIPIAGALVTGNAPYVSGVSALTYSALNLAGGSGWITGILPPANGGTGLSALGTADQLLGINHAGTALAYFTSAGDVSLNTGVFTVIALQGFSVVNTTPTANQALVWNAGTSKWTPTTLAAAGSVTGSGVWHSTSGTLDAAASKGTAGQFLLTNSAATDTAWTTLSGDVTASTSTVGQITVAKIQGNPVSGTAATAGQFLIENSGATGSAWTTISGDATASTGTPGLLTVVALQTFGVATATPTSGQVLQWNSGTSKWTPTTPAGAASVTGSGVWHSTAGLLDSAASKGTAGQALFTNAAATDTAWTTFSGDVTASTGTPGAITVVKIQGNQVSATSPTAGQFLVENSSATGSAWTSFSGDVSLSAGTPGLATVTGIRSNSVPALATGFLQWTGSVFAWASTPTAITGSGIWHNTAGVLDAAASKGTAGQYLLTNAGASDTAWTTLSGDVVSSLATVGQISVVKVNGAAIPAAGALTTGNAPYVSGPTALTYSALNLAGGSGWVTGALPATNGGTGLSAAGTADQLLGMNHTASALNFFTAAGDVSLASGSFTVIALQSFSIASTTPTANQVLTWNSGTSKWTPTNLPSGSSVTGSGVWHSTSGTLDVAASKGTAGQALFTNAGATDTAWATITGDLTASTGTPGSITVSKVNGSTIPSGGALTTGNAPYVSGAAALTYSALNLAGGSGWVTGALPATNGGTGLSALGTADQLLGMTHAGTALNFFSLSQDGSIASGALTVTGIRANNIPALSAGFLQWTGAAFAWSSAPVSVTGSGIWHNTAGVLDSAASKGTAGQFYVTNAAATDTAWATVTGDASNSTSTAGKLTITGLQGNPVSGTAATAGQFLVENSGATGSAWTSMSGDVSLSAVTPGLATVTGIRGSTIPTPSGTNTALVWSGSSFSWGFDASSVPGTTLVFQPGGVASQNVFTDWSSLFTASGSVVGPLVVFFDTTFNSGAATIPSGTYNFTQPSVNFVGPDFITQSDYITVTCANGATISGLSGLYGGIVLTSVSTSAIISVGGTSSKALYMGRGAELSASASAPFVLVSGSAKYGVNVESAGGIVGANPVLTASGTSSVINVVLKGNAGVTANSVTGPTPANLNIFLASSAASNATTGTTQTLEAFSANTIYNDALVAPTTGATTAQGAIDFLKSHSTAAGGVLVFQPGGTALGNVFTSWAPLVTAAANITGPLVVYFDGSLNSDVSTIPSGTWNFNQQRTTFESWCGQFSGVPHLQDVQFANGAIVNGVRFFNKVRLTSLSSSTTFAFTVATELEFDGCEVRSLSTGSLFSFSGGALSDSILLRGNTLVETGSAPSFTSTAALSTFYLFDLAVLRASSISGSPMQIGIASPGCVNQTTGIPVVYYAQAINEGYNDALVSPAISQTTVQGAIDYLKSHTASAAITQLTGDVLAGPGSGSQAATVVAISGSSPFPIHPANLQWVQATANPTWSQQQQANGLAPANMSIAPQAPGASPTNGTNGTPGSVLVALAAPTGSGANAALTVTDGGSNVVSIGKSGSNGAITWAAGIAAAAMLQLTATSNVAAASMTLSAQSAFASATGANRTGGNVIIQGGVAAAGGTTGSVVVETGDGNCGIIVGSKDIEFLTVTALGNYIFGGAVGNGGGQGMLTLAVAGTNPTSAPSSNGLFLYNNGSGQLGLWGSEFFFNQNVASPSVTHVQASADVATTNFTVQAQSAFSSATTNKNGGNLILLGGTAATGGTQGSASMQDGGLNFKVSATPTLASMQNASATIFAQVQSSGVRLNTSKSNMIMSDSSGDVSVLTALSSAPIITNYIGVLGSGSTSSQAGIRRRFCGQGQITSNGGQINLDIPVPGISQGSGCIIDFKMQARLIVAGNTASTIGDSETITGTCSFTLNGSSTAVPYGGNSNNCTIIASNQMGDFAGGGTNTAIAVPTPSISNSARLSYLIAAFAGTLGTADCTIWADVFYN